MCTKCGENGKYKTSKDDLKAGDCGKNGYMMRKCLKK